MLQQDFFAQVFVDQITLTQHSLVVRYAINSADQGCNGPLFRVVISSGGTSPSYINKVEREFIVSRMSNYIDGSGDFEYVIDIENISKPLLVMEIIAMPGLRLTSSEVENREKITLDIFPINDKSYSEMFIRATQRWKEPSSVFFIGNQIAEFFAGSASNRCGAAVVLGYKAVELGDQTRLRLAQDVLQKAQEWVKDCKLDWHPRRNIEHLNVSILTSLWHVQMLLLDYVGVKESLLKIYENSFSISNYFTPAYPITKSLLLLGYLYVLEGSEQEGANVLNRCIEVFRLCVRDSDQEQITLFGEISESFKAAKEAAIFLQKLRGGDFDEVGSASIIAKQSFRVKDDAANRMLEKMLVLVEGRSNIKPED